MAQEIELKLAVPDAAAAAALVAWLDANARAVGESHLLNVYFDTPAHELAQARAALRLRRDGKRWLQTLKTAGRSEAGLATRNEWETEVAGEALEPAKLDDEARALLEPLLGRLRPVFRTDFVRRTWRLRCPLTGAGAGETHGQAQGEAEIEAALDAGVIAAVSEDGTTPASGSARETIHELELEWLSGDPSQAAATLRALGERLGAVAALTPSDRSKAARGYALAKQAGSPAGAA
ncbi:CYTH domain-containing protein [Cupriavidus gilardii]|uniref:CYTH domain-containing protein n=1 Tax=Cupriavidus gilardii TaxID=82541 RepID=UPI0021B3CE8B|nr:CYTH domain-containing protein [Cupriavidus gilardii]UXC36378.1 CYTH domain-containing protein [Cupriavidus gilardii]